MIPNDGPLQTGEHILAKIIEDRIAGARVVIAKFSEDSGSLDVSSETDLREYDIPSLEADTNAVISKCLPVKKYVLSRAEAEKSFDLSRIPPCVGAVRIVEIGDFDKRPCKDPHVDNTKDVGKFTVTKVERVGNDRYRFSFKVE
jgi:threonyl-tRNA synthetase